MVIEHRLIHPSSNRNAAFTRRTGSTQPRSRNEPPSIRYSYCAETTHCSTAFVSRGCTGKGALASALLVERKSRGINVLYRCGCNAYGRCLSLKQNSREKPSSVSYVYYVFLSTRESDRTCTFHNLDPSPNRGIKEQGCA